jgi:hypothetical protein
MTEAEDGEWVAALIEQIEWYDETFTRTGRFMPDDFEAYQEEFRLWKAREEERR